jgi:hypothetical protein
MKYFFNGFVFKSTFLFWLLCLSGAYLGAQNSILPGALTGLPSQLKGKKVGVVAHQASLLPICKAVSTFGGLFTGKNINVQSVFAP